MNAAPRMPVQIPIGKSLSQLTREDREALLTLLQWDQTPLKDCSKKQLLECIVYMAAQTVMLKDKLDQAQTPWYTRLKRWISRKFINKPPIIMAGTGEPHVESNS